MFGLVGLVFLLSRLSEDKVEQGRKAIDSMNAALLSQNDTKAIVVIFGDGRDISGHVIRLP